MLNQLGIFKKLCIFFWPVKRVYIGDYIMIKFRQKGHSCRRLNSALITAFVPRWFDPIA